MWVREYVHVPHPVVGLVPHPVVGLVLQNRKAEKFPPALDLESIELFLRVSKQGPCLTALEEDGDDKRPVQLELACFGCSLETKNHVRSAC